MNAYQVVTEVIRFNQGKPEYVPTRQDTSDIEAKKPRTTANEINTYLPHGRSLKTRGAVDPYMTRRILQTIQGQKVLRILYAFTRKSVSGEYLDAVKLADFEGSGLMLGHVADYFAKAFLRHKFDTVVPAPSSKPLAAKLAEEIANRLNIPVGHFFSKIGKATDTDVSHRMDVEKAALAINDLIYSDILLVDDFTTSNSTLMELATKLYNKGANYVVAVALAGPAQE